MTLQLPDFQCCDTECKSGVKKCMLCNALIVWKMDGHKWKCKNDSNKWGVVSRYKPPQDKYYKSAAMSKKRLHIHLLNNERVHITKLCNCWYIRIYIKNHILKARKYFCLNGHNIIDLYNVQCCELCKLQKINQLQNNNTLSSTIPTPLICKIVEYHVKYNHQLLIKDIDDYFTELLKMKY